MTHKQARKLKHQRAVDQVARQFDELMRALLDLGDYTFEPEAKQLRNLGYSVVNKSCEQSNGRRAIGV